MRGLRTQLHEEFQGQFITIKYRTQSNDEIKDYNCKLEGKEKELKNRNDSTGIDNIVIRVYDQNGLKKVRQLIPERIISISGRGKVVKPVFHHRLRLTSLQNIS